MPKKKPWKLTSEYNTWYGMVHRCTNPQNSAWGYYGGRGIKVCDRWKNSFPNFLEDMGPKPTTKHEIDRVNNDGNYELSNCRWATRKQQNRNKRTNHLISYNGETKCLADWAEATGIPKSAIEQRLRILGWSIHKTLTTPSGSHALKFSINGVTKTVFEWTKTFGIRYSRVIERIKNSNWSIHDALFTPKLTNSQAATLGNLKRKGASK